MTTGGLAPEVRAGESASGGKDPLGNVARRIVQLQKEFSGKGPTKVKAHLNDDMVVVLLRGGFTAVEQTLAAEGEEELVLEQRQAFQRVMNERYVAVVEEEIGRKVVAFMSANHHDPNLAVEVFVLEQEDASGEVPEAPA